MCVTSPTIEVMDERSHAPHAIEPVLTIENLEKVYGRRGAVSYALRDVSFTVERGEFVAIMGPSGSGKTTLLSCVGTLERPTSGRICLSGTDVTRLGRRRLAEIRRTQLGIIFQESNLIDTLTGFENIALALTMGSTPSHEVRHAVERLAARLGIGEELDRFPSHMSGGQRQRIAAARALAVEPDLLLADEPTGALDSHAAARLLETLESLNAAGSTILMVTHDPFAASFSSRLLLIRDGQIFNEIRRGGQSQRDYRRHILNLQAFLGGEANVG